MDNSAEFKAFPPMMCIKSDNVKCNCFDCRLTELVNWNSATPEQRRKMLVLIKGGKCD